jgi:hypothetical protein
MAAIRVQAKIAMQTSHRCSMNAGKDDTQAISAFYFCNKIIVIITNPVFRIYSSDDKPASLFDD